jgi:hypothetical protein
MEWDFFVKKLETIYAFCWNKLLNLGVFFHFFEILWQSAGAFLVIFMKRIVPLINLPDLKHDLIDKIFFLKIQIIILFSGCFGGMIFLKRLIIDWHKFFNFLLKKMGDLFIKIDSGFINLCSGKF